MATKWTGERGRPSTSCCCCPPRSGSRKIRLIRLSSLRGESASQRVSLCWLFSCLDRDHVCVCQTLITGFAILVDNLLGFSASRWTVRVFVTDEFVCSRRLHVCSKFKAPEPSKSERLPLQEQLHKLAKLFVKSNTTLTTFIEALRNDGQDVDYERREVSSSHSHCIQLQERAVLLNCHCSLPIYSCHSCVLLNSPCWCFALLFPALQIHRPPGARQFVPRLQLVQSRAELASLPAGQDQVAHA